MKATCLRSLPGLCGLLLLGWPPTLMSGQTRGATDPVPYSVNFTTTGQSMWGPANAPSNIDFTFTLFDEGWSEGGSENGIVDALGTQWGGSISGSTSGAVGLSLRFFNIGTGEVNATYPVRVVLDVPQANSFRDGEAVTIGSRFELLPGWSLTTSPPGGTLAINGRFGTSLAASGRVCVFGCSPSFDLLPRVNIPTDPFELFQVSSTGGIRFPNLLPSPPFPSPLVISTMPYQFGALLDPFGGVLGIEGPVDAPRVATAAVLSGDGRSIVAAGTHKFVDLAVDLDQYLTLVGVPPLGVQTNEGLSLVTGASFGYDIADLALLLEIAKRQSFSLLPTVKLTARFPQPLSFAVVDAGGATIQEGTGSAVTFDVGHSLRLIFPSGTRTPLQSTPTYELRNTFRSQSSFDFDERLVLSAGAFNLSTPSKSVTSEQVSTVCSFTWIAVGVCEFFGGILQTITHTITDVAPAVSVNLGPLAVATLVDEMQTVPLFPSGGGSGEWELQGFQAFTEAPFLLDPEDPRIVVTTDLASAVLASGGPAGALSQMITVRNEGDVPLSAVQLEDAVSSAIAGGTLTLLSVSSSTLTTNPTFNGGADVELLGGGAALGVGEEGVVRILWSVTPGSIYRVAVAATGTSPIGTVVSGEAFGELGVVAFEIIPDQVSAWSNGVLPVRILSQGIDASRIDAATVRLEGVPTSQYNLTASGDLILKYPLQSVLNALEMRLQSQAPILAVTAGAGGARAGQKVTAVVVGAALLGESGRLTADAATDVDRAGNANGSLDIGDLRMLVMAGRRPGGQGIASGLLNSSSDVSHVLVATGLLDDLTPFIGEDDLSVMTGGK